MIDTVKFYTMIDYKTYNKVLQKSIIKTSYSKKTGEVFYEIINDKLEGSFSSSLSVRVGSGSLYKFLNNYYIELEGSLHKILKGYNALNGFYNIVDIFNKLLSLVESHYNITLPSIQHWFVGRIDISKCFDLNSNENVKNYINNLSQCNYPRRKIKHYQDESIYMTGSTTTLKIYNKLLEFKKHDYQKLANNGFNVFNFCDLIDGFVRFECEIKKKKLEKLYNKKYIRLRNISYRDLENVWREEFMKLIKMFETDLPKVYKKKEVERRLNTMYGYRMATPLYNFYISICSDGIENVKKRTSKATYYRYIKMLKQANIDISQRFSVDFDDLHIDFDPFTYPEVI